MTELIDRLKTLLGPWGRRLARPRTRIILVALVAALAAGGVGSYILTRGSDLPAGVALRYDGQDVSITTIDAEARTLSALYGVTAPTDPAGLSDFHRAMAKSYAVSLVVDHAARAEGVSVPDKTVQDVMGTYVVGQFGSGANAYDRFVQALAAAGTTQEAVRVEVQRQLVLSALFEAVTKDVKVSAGEVRTYFDEHRASLGRPATRRLSNIVVATRAEARAILRRYGRGASFASLAATYSLDGATRSKGGNLGYVAVAALDPGYGKVAFSSLPGRAFGPVETDSGWNIGVVRAVRAASAPRFAAERTSLANQIKLTKQLAAWRAWLASQISAAGVEYADAYRPADPDAAPSGSPGISPVPSASGAE